MATPRITAPLVKGIIDDHLTRHKDVYNKKICKHERALFGESGDDGLVYSQKETNMNITIIKEKLDTMNKLGCAVTIAVATELVIKVTNL